MFHISSCILFLFHCSFIIYNRIMNIPLTFDRCSRSWPHTKCASSGRHNQGLMNETTLWWCNTTAYTVSEKPRFTMLLPCKENEIIVCVVYSGACIDNHSTEVHMWTQWQHNAHEVHDRTVGWSSSRECVHCMHCIVLHSKLCRA